MSQVILRLLPNAITGARGLAGPVVAVLLLRFEANLIAFWLFILAALTDLIDGWLAKRFGSDPVVGALLDPLADKTLVGCTWLALWWHGWAPWWLVFPSLLRDGTVSLLWRYHQGRGRVFTPSAVGQITVAYEGTALGVLLFHGPWNGTHWPSVGVAIGLCGLALSLTSAVSYLFRRAPPAAAHPPT